MVLQSEQTSPPHEDEAFELLMFFIYTPSIFILASDA